jgi:hypothetical protein
MLKYHSHVRRGGLICKRHHGKTRIQDVEDLESVDVVLTTYHTLTSEWRRHSPSSPMAIFTLGWYRVVLDEGMLDALRNNTHGTDTKFVFSTRYSCG